MVDGIWIDFDEAAPPQASVRRKEIKMVSCVSSAVRASLKLDSWKGQLELSYIGSWRSAGGAAGGAWGFAYCTTSVLCVL